MNPASAPDKDLIARVLIGGERDAFGFLVHRYQGQIRGVLLQLTKGNRALADDLAQECFASAYQNLVKFEGRASFSTWLTRIAINHYLMHVRKKENQHISLEYKEDNISSGQPTMESVSTARLDLKQAMSHLRKAEHMAITLCYMFGLTHEEAALAMTIPLGTLKSHIKRGKMKLRQILDTPLKETAG